MSAEENALVARWSKTGLLDALGEGEDYQRKLFCAMILEGQKSLRENGSRFERLRMDGIKSLGDDDE